MCTEVHVTTNLTKVTNMTVLENPKYSPKEKLGHTPQSGASGREMSHEIERKAFVRTAAKGNF